MTERVLMGRLRGDHFDGEEVEVVGARVIYPVATEQWARENFEWGETYGVAWAWENADGYVEHPVTPPPPSMPTVTYRWTHENGEWIGVLDD